MPDLKAKVTNVVLKILNDEERRGLADLDALRKKIYSFAVQITGMTPTECAESYSPFADCYDAIISIAASKEDLVGRFSILKVLLDKVISIKDEIFVSFRYNGGDCSNEAEFVLNHPHYGPMIIIICIP